MKKLLCLLIIQGIGLSCSNNPNSEPHGGSQPIPNKIPTGGGSKPILNKCPSDGVNLYIKCADGREKVFGIGFKDKPFYVLKDGIFMDSLHNFCIDNTAKVSFYFTRGSFRVTAKRANGDQTIYRWQSVKSACERSYVANYVVPNLNYNTLKIDSNPNTKATSN